MGKMFVFFLLAHVFVSSSIPVGLASVVEATHRFVLLAGWGKISHDASGRVVAFSSGRSFFSKSAFPLARR